MVHVLLPPVYLGNIYYYNYLTSYSAIIEQYANHARKTYMNRCMIMTSGGVQTLSIPVKKAKDKCLVKDLKIANNYSWQKEHWHAIETAYNSSPFFEYYKDDLASLYIQKFDFLLDFDLAVQNRILALLDYTDTNIELSDSYEKELSADIIDLRNIFVPKNNTVNLPDKLKTPYYQVFDGNIGFTPNLSIIDLLFNMGNESRIYLSKISKL